MSRNGSVVSPAIGLSPATFLDDLVIKGRVSKWGTSSFELAWEGTVADEAGSVRDVFRGWMTHVCVETKPDGSRKSTAIDPEFRAKIVARRRETARAVVKAFGTYGSMNT